MAHVLMNNSHPAPSGVQPQNAPDTRPTLEETADRILAKVDSPLREGEVRGVVEALEKALELQYPMSLRARRRCFRGLVKICGERNILPSFLNPRSRSWAIPPLIRQFLTFGRESIGRTRREKASQSRLYGTASQTMSREQKRGHHLNILELIGATSRLEKDQFQSLGFLDLCTHCAGRTGDTVHMVLLVGTLVGANGKLYLSLINEIISNR